MNDVLAAIDAGVGAGYINIYTAGYALLLVTIAFADPSGVVAGAVLTFSNMPRTGLGLAPGNAAIARIYDSAATMVCDGLTVGLVGTDIIIDNVSIAVGQTVNITGGSITHG
jgi:hypothetical protein